MTRRLIVALFACAAGLPLHADEPPRTDEPDERSTAQGARGLAQIGGITSQLRQLGEWEDFYETVAPGIDEFWQRRGWHDEADEFARRTLHDVAAIPPWEFQNRMNHLLGAVRDRYGLNEEQYKDMQSRTYQFIGGMVWRHGRMFYNHTREMVETRVRGEPFSAEQVARWTRESEPVFHEERERLEQMAAEFAQALSPEQQEIYQRDVASYNRRMQAVDELRKRWEAGDWQPEDWGLQRDPLHQEVIERRAQDAAHPAESAEAPAEAYDESAWARYVRDYIRRFDLDDAQATAAWSILHELEARAADYRRLHRVELQQVAPENVQAAPPYQPIRAMFEELRRRLLPIPTDAQRRRAPSAAPADPRLLPGLPVPQFESAPAEEFVAPPE